MAKCKKCKEFVSFGDKFCTKCGAKAPNDIEIRCPKCNSLVFDSHLFCKDCGKKVDRKKLKKIVIKK